MKLPPASSCRLPECLYTAAQSLSMTVSHPGHFISSPVSVWWRAVSGTKNIQGKMFGCVSLIYMCAWSDDLEKLYLLFSTSTASWSKTYITDAHFVPKSLNRVKNYLSRAPLLQTIPVIREGIPRLFWSPYSHISMVALLFICDVYFI